MAPSHTPHEWILRAVAPDSAPGLVLVIDEDEPVLRALRRILEADRHRVALAARSAEAARVLEDPALDVVLVDRMVQEASGLALLAEIKRARPDVKVIVMTAHVSVNDAVECMRRGAFDYLGKPFEDLRRVRDSVRRAVDRRRQSVSGGRRLAERDPARAGDGQPGWAVQGDGEAAAGSGELPLSLDAYEKSALERALRESAGDAGAAARRLGIGRSTFYRKLAKHGIGDGREAVVQAGRHRGRVGPHSPIG